MKNSKLSLVMISLSALIISVLLICTINYQYQIGSSINLGNGKSKYFIAAILILIPILTLILLKSYNSKKPFVENYLAGKKIFDFNSTAARRKEVSANEKTVKQIKVVEDGIGSKCSMKASVVASSPIPQTTKVVTEDGEVVEETSDSRFFMLSQIDKAQEDKITPVYNNKINLEELCNDFRNFASYKMKLYYDIKDIRRFIAGLAVTKILILQGMSGTGKTSLALAFGEFVKNKIVLVPIQPMWKERTDLIGYYNEFTRKFTETTLLYKMYEANYSKDIYVTILDEMNIARVEYYFAEFLSLLEVPNPDERDLAVVSDVWETDPKLLKDGKIKLPINMWFIGTANNDDSTFAISDKVYDRAMVLNLDTKAEVFEGEPSDGQKISIDHITELFKNAQKEYKLSARNLRRIKQLDKYLIQTFHITFGNRIMKQIESYIPVLVACGGTELDGIDDVLSRKVLRKLESKNPVYVKSQSEALCNYLDELFGSDKMPLCKEVIHNIEQNA